MPSLSAHRYIDLLYFGKSYWKIHREMDKPVKYLGRGHRVLFHDSISATLIAKHHYPNDPNAIWAALQHIYYDNQCTEDPELKMYIETQAKLSRKRRRAKPKLKAVECPIKIRECPCFLYRAWLMRDPSEARRICPHRM
jgi:hypothetical protein